MSVSKRILAGLSFLLATAALLLSLTGGIGIWIVKEPVTAKATRIFERVYAALDIADEGLDHVKTSLARAAERLDSAREEQRRLAQGPRQNNVTQRLLAPMVLPRIAPDFGEAHQTLHKVAEAAIVVNSVLEDVGTVPFLSVTGLDVGDLTRVNSLLSQVESSAWGLSRLLGEPASDPDSDAVSPQLSRIEQALKTMQGLLAEYEPQLTQVRQRTEQLRSRILSSITPATVLVSLVCFWIALSQVSLLSHAWSWWKKLA
jgi:hypothetical protein